MDQLTGWREAAERNHTTEHLLQSEGMQWRRGWWLGKSVSQNSAWVRGGRWPWLEDMFLRKMSLAEV